MSRYIFGLSYGNCRKPLYTVSASLAQEKVPVSSEEEADYSEGAGRLEAVGPNELVPSLLSLMDVDIGVARGSAGVCFWSGY